MPSSRFDNQGQMQERMEVLRYGSIGWVAGDGHFAVFRPTLILDRYGLLLLCNPSLTCILLSMDLAIHSSLASEETCRKGGPGMFPGRGEIGSL